MADLRNGGLLPHRPGIKQTNPLNEDGAWFTICRMCGRRRVWNDHWPHRRQFRL